MSWNLSQETQRLVPVLALALAAATTACGGDMNPGESGAEHIPVDQATTTSALNGGTCRLASDSSRNMWWECNHSGTYRRVTQVAIYRQGPLATSDFINDFLETAGSDRVTWRFTSNSGSKSYAYHSNDYSGSSMRQITQTAYDFYHDEITEAKVVGRFLTWRYWNGEQNYEGYYSRNTKGEAGNPTNRLSSLADWDVLYDDWMWPASGAYLNGRFVFSFSDGFSGDDYYGYNCIKQATPMSPIRITQVAGSGETIYNFAVSGNIATWSFSDRFNRRTTHQLTLQTCPTP